MGDSGLNSSTITPVSASFSQSIVVAQTKVIVPSELSVSNANSYRPSADIVWHGDAAGDRHLQVQALFEQAASRVTSGYDGITPVILEITVTKFHGVTPKARYSIGGWHNIEYDVRILDAQTGAQISGPHSVDAKFKALGGENAVAAEAQGITQKVRVIDRITDTLGAAIYEHHSGALVARSALETMTSGLGSITTY